MRILPALESIDRLVSRGRAIRVAALLTVVTTFGLVLLAGSGMQTLDALGRPVGTDFSNVYAAGRLALAGAPELAWDWPSHFAMQQAVHGRADIPFYGWHYPPPFLIVAMALASIPYLPALILWQVTGLATALAAVRPLLTRPGDWVIALGFPAVFVCLGHGQNGFLTAALLGGGMLLLDRRPIAAGILIGLLAYKPQLGVLLPLVLAAGGHWRAFAVAAATLLVMSATSALVLGTGAWEAFAQSLELTRSAVVEDAQTGAAKLVTPFGAVRLLGGAAWIAWIIQSAAIAGLAAVIIRTRRCRPALRGAVAMTASLLATPYAFDYDMVVLGIAIAWLARDAETNGWRRGERALLAFAYCAPLFGRAVAAATLVPVNLIAIAVVLAVALARSSPALTASPCRHLHAASAQ
ncbi:glycosyltransferase family 87 protein [Sphingomonas japonica]|uniref:DUF2029 domain-containing protein n=1 Tax=Sphingomonas japonica TaxID=511662 RepID=A0ABX0U2G7_9SPHN|nr:glycosyltransferase family 87 protein [Sphingomonas japonica]NIJ24764.1 hypothetical protein [Sphingomonas japonica]